LRCRSNETSAGERDAILLAQEIQADELIVDACVAGGKQSDGICISSVRSACCAQPQGNGCSILGALLAVCVKPNFHIAQEILDRLLKDEE